MKTNTIIIGLYGNPKNVQRVSGHWKDDFETKQVAVYTVAEGLATIESLTPVIATNLNLPLPFTLPVNDLGSGQLEHIDINCDTMTAHIATCPSQKWAEHRTQRPALPIPQQLIADYCSLL